MQEEIKKAEPMARMMRKEDRLYTERKGNRIIFVDPREPNTTVTPMIGTRLEFFMPVKAGALEVKGRMHRCIYRHVWLSSLESGARKAALEFEHCLVYVDQIDPHQEVYVQEIP